MFYRQYFFIISICRNLHYQYMALSKNHEERKRDHEERGRGTIEKIEIRITLMDPSANTI